jgi:phytoene dehydrogenase-like protein
MNQSNPTEPILNQSLSKSNYDAIVIGGGHNGLVAAAYLAKEGQRVAVIERRPVLGGAAATEEIFPGFRANTGAGDAGLFLDQIVMDLNLKNHGLEFVTSPVLSLSLQTEEPPLALWRDQDRAAAEIARFSESDSQKYADFLDQMDRFANVLDFMRIQSPPSVPRIRYRELWPWLRVALKAKRLGNQEMMSLLRILPMPVAEFLDEWFETPLFKAAMGFRAVTGGFQGPRAAGTTFTFLYHGLGAGRGNWFASRFVRGGMGELSRALAKAAQHYGAGIISGQTVTRIIVERNRAVGVALGSGERISSQVVISNADPRHTYFDLVGPEQLEVRFVREIKNIQFRGSTARVNLALSGLPLFKGLDLLGGSVELAERLSGHILICPDLDDLERAYDDAKYGRISQNPCLDILIPTILDPSLAPEDHHIMSIDVRYAPYLLSEGTWDQEKETLKERVIGILERYAPGIKSLILHQSILTPWDYEQVYGLPEGSIYHGQMSLDQLFFMRPVPGCERYQGPVENLFLCGAGTHPGGGVSGAPGLNAAREVIKGLRSI